MPEPEPAAFIHEGEMQTRTSHVRDSLSGGRLLRLLRGGTSAEPLSSSSSEPVVHVLRVGDSVTIQVTGLADYHVRLDPEDELRPEGTDA